MSRTPNNRTPRETPSPEQFAFNARVESLHTQSSARATALLAALMPTLTGMAIASDEPTIKVHCWHDEGGAFVMIAFSPLHDQRGDLFISSPYAEVRVRTTPANTVNLARWLRELDSSGALMTDADRMLHTQPSIEVAVTYSSTNLRFSSDNESAFAAAIGKCISNATRVATAIYNNRAELLSAGTR